MTGATLDCILVTYPIEQLHQDTFERLHATFKKVHFYPGEDGSGTYTEYGEPKLPPPEVYAEADAILAFVMPTNLTHISQTPRLKLWQVFGSGTNMVTQTEFWRSIPSEHPLVLSNIAGTHAVTIGEHVLMTSVRAPAAFLEATPAHTFLTQLMHFHKMWRCIEASRRGHWAGPTELDGLFIKEIRGLTVGIITYGNIAREISRLFNALGAKVIVCTRDGKAKPVTGFQVEGTGDPDASIPEQWFTTKKEDLHKFLGVSDIVVDMMPSSPATNKFIGRAELEAMKDTALFVNCGRGDTVDTEALVEALSSKAPATGAPGTFAIGGASLDVTDPEPLPEGHVLFTMDNVIVTPHCSWASENIYQRVMDLLVENKSLVEQGKEALNSLRTAGKA
ncbi:2-hydroxyacid dehydrogenase [Pseudohyphozyma bogoriensis]|nr:2-hydroxyacid dehydrogenase [Pseudohyphozyma bogoriensis]